MQKSVDSENSYIECLSRELRRHAIPEAESQQVLDGVKEMMETSSRTPEEEFGSPRDYVQSLYPGRPSKRYYLFTLVGIIIAVVGFIGLHVYFESIGPKSVTSLWKFAPLLAMPIGMAIDTYRYQKA